MNEAVRIDQPDVARTQPAVDQSLGRRLWFVPIALEQRRRAHTNLAFVADRHQRTGLEIGDLEFRAWYRQPDKDRLRIEIEVVVLEAGGEGGGGVGFRHAPRALSENRAGKLVPASPVVGVQFLDERDHADLL